MKRECEVMELYESNQRLVGHMVTSMNIRIPGYDLEDFLQVGRIALWRAAKEYDEAKGIEFSSFACICIERALLDLLKKRYANGRQQELTMQSLSDIVFTSDSGDEISLGEMIPCKTDLEEEVSTKVFVELLLGGLDDRSAYIIKEHYLRGRTMSSLAKEFNVARCTMTKWFSEATVQMRKIAGDKQAYTQYYKMKNSSNVVQRQVKRST